MQNSIFGKKCFGHELHSFLAREYKRIPLSFDIFMNWNLENTYDCIIELLFYKPFIVIFHCKSTSNKDQSGSTTFTITAKCTSFSSSRQRHLPKFSFSKVSMYCKIEIKVDAVGCDITAGKEKNCIWRRAKSQKKRRRF